MTTIKISDKVILTPTAGTIAYYDDDYNDTIDRLEKSYAQAYAEGDRSSCEFLHNLIVELEW
ncbi:MAG: hypothetical protein II670_07535 [Alphaproteobacteria bacterium]|nr:hypothetical protein [Alphaproteobacteria bacterium]